MAPKRMQDTVPFVKGFRLPSEKERQGAVGWRGEPSPEYRFNELYPSITLPQSENDWLAQYYCRGQTFTQFLNQCPWLGSTKWRGPDSVPFKKDGANLCERYPCHKIYLIEVGEFSRERATFAPEFNKLVQYTEFFFEVPVETLSKAMQKVGCGEVKWKLPAKKDGARSTWHSIEHRSHDRSGRQQLNVSSCLRALKSAIPDDAFCLIALTMEDLYGGESDLFVAGMAAGNSGVAIFSFARYDPCLTFSEEFWWRMQICRGKTSDEERQAKVLQRSCKLLVHDTAHLLGLKHCIFSACCMQGSGHLAEDFSQPMHLCPVCLRKLQHLCGFDVVQRYRKLSEFYTSNGMHAEQAWVERRLGFIACCPSSCS